MRLPDPPLPVDVGASERIPFLFVLDELEAAGFADAGLALWQSLRNVRTWREARADGPTSVLNARAGRIARVVPELEPRLASLARELTGKAARGAGRAARVAEVCQEVAGWAEGRGAYRTALAYLQEARALCPGEPHLAYAVGRMARKLALYAPAEAWLRWARREARCAGRWEVAVLAVSGLANLFRQRGRLGRARRLHGLAGAMAARHGFRTLHGDALYDLAGLAFDFGQPERGMELARGALEAYGPGHPRLPGLARDVAWFWMDGSGEFESAADVFAALLDVPHPPEERINLLAAWCRAAAGAGRRFEFEQAWAAAHELMPRQPARERHAVALVQMSLGAAALGEWARAADAAREALAVARGRGESEFVFQAEAALEAALRGAEAAAQTRRPAADADGARRLAHDLVRAVVPAREAARAGA
jgi:tetratricopeptide (TPR) repeat protein